jgi:hypothetical protein
MRTTGGISATAVRYTRLRIEEASSITKLRVASATHNADSDHLR